MLATSVAGAPAAKRRALAKPARKQKPGEESRLGAKRQKKEADAKFEECCQAVLGARVGVWWEDDECYYKVRTSIGRLNGYAVRKTGPILPA